MNAQTRKKKTSSIPKSDARLSRAVSFVATEEEYERWKQSAEKGSRTLSWWIRNRLLEMERIEQEFLARSMETADSILSHAGTGADKRQ